jgi:hypothetical protein
VKFIPIVAIAALIAGGLWWHGGGVWDFEYADSYASSSKCLGLEYPVKKSQGQVQFQFVDQVKIAVQFYGSKRDASRGLANAPNTEIAEQAGPDLVISNGELSPQDRQGVAACVIVIKRERLSNAVGFGFSSLNRPYPASLPKARSDSIASIGGQLASLTQASRAEQAFVTRAVNDARALTAKKPATNPGKLLDDLRDAVHRGRQPIQLYARTLASTHTADPVLNAFRLASLRFARKIAPAFARLDTAWKVKDHPPIKVLAAFAVLANSEAHRLAVRATKIFSSKSTTLTADERTVFVEAARVATSP